jgi:hypothetical protein
MQNTNANGFDKDTKLAQAVPRYKHRLLQGKSDNSGKAVPFFLGRLPCSKPARPNFRADGPQAVNFIQLHSRFIEKRLTSV